MHNTDRLNQLRCDYLAAIEAARTATTDAERIEWQAAARQIDAERQAESERLYCPATADLEPALAA